MFPLGCGSAALCLFVAMTPWFPARSYTVTLVAQTGERFADFAPYVPSINDDGVITFGRSNSFYRE